MQNQNNEKYEKFFADFKRFKDEADLSKKRGNNDYNPLLVIRSTSDELGLHSRMLHSFLDVSGEHYQEDLFLKEFLKMAKLEDFFGTTKSARVMKESSNIDILIENGENFIILENKIYAGDQEAQIARYIDEISKPSKDSQSGEEIAAVPFENIAVIYLTPKKHNPSEYSLKEWEISKDKKSLEKDGKSVKLALLSYEKDILEWIANCQKEVGNITNLNAAFEFYKDAVQRITGQKEYRMSIKDFLNTGDEAEILQKFKIVFEIRDKQIEIDKTYLKFLLNKSEFKDWQYISQDTQDKFEAIIRKDYINNKFKFAIGKFKKEREGWYCGAKLILNLEYPKDIKEKIYEYVVKQLKEHNIMNTTAEKDWFLWDYNIEYIDEILNNKKDMKEIQKANQFLKEQEENIIKSLYNQKIIS